MVSFFIIKSTTSIQEIYIYIANLDNRANDREETSIRFY
jgi:hypothetical protein